MGLKGRLALVTLIFLSACDRTSNSNTQTQTNPQPVPKAIQAGDFDLTIQFAGVRKYQVHIPTRAVSQTTRSVVFALHGGGGDIASLKSTAFLDEASDQFGFIVVYPQGTATITGGREYGSWNAGVCCAPANTNNVDDVAFFSRLIDQVVSDYGVDPKRVYVTGHSNGGMMSYRLACELSEKIAAIAPVGAQNTATGCAPKRKVPTIHAHGTADNCSPYNGGTCGGCFGTFFSGLGIPYTSVTWACDSVPVSINKWRAIHGDVNLVTVNGMGHTWPGGVYGSVCNNPGSYICNLWQTTVGPLSNYPFNAEMWQFFESHPIP